jgi:uncharacterized protein involved in tolerance to divalent cations
MEYSTTNFYTLSELTRSGCEKYDSRPVSSIYIWSRNLIAQSEASFVLTAHTKTIERDWN